MLVDSESWLEKDQEGNNEVSNDLMVFVEFVNSLAEDDTQSEADDEEDQAEELERCMDEANSLCVGKV